VGDQLDEADEQFTLNLSGATNATIATAAGTATITDDDPLPSITIGDRAVAEGNTGSTNVAFTITLSALSGRDVTVAYATANDTATAGSDYVAVSGTATITAGSTSTTVNVAVTGDVLFEPAETFVVNLSGPTNATIGDPQATGTITNDEPTPALSIGNASANEGGPGTFNAVFTVSLSSGSAQTVTVAYATADGTATAGTDYTAGSGTLTFAPGETSKTVTVPLTGDTLNEADEQFVVNLSNAVNAPITTAQGVGTILNDDPLPSITIGDVSVTEGNAGAQAAAFTVTLSAASGRTVTVAYATADATASSASDYGAASGTLTFNPGTTSAVVNVTVNGDTLPESTETFAVNLSAPTNATIGDAQATGTIVNDEALPVLAIAGVSVTEGNAGTVNAVFTVTLNPASSQSVSVNYATANGTASSASDYAAASGTLTFGAGETSKTVSVAVNGDGTNETDEQFVVNLSGAVAATISTAQGVGTIANDDPLPSITVADVATTEGNTGSKLLTFTLALSAASGQTVTVSVSTANGTATSGSDYVATGTTVVFNPGTTTANVPVNITGDVIFEGDETFVLNLTTPTNATISDAQAIGTIQNDEATPALSITDVTVTEGNAGTANAVLNVTLSPVSSLPVTVDWSTANATAAAGTDYTAASGTLTFAPGVAAQSITTVVTGDLAIEPNETYQVNLSLPSGATLLDGQGIVTITNDEVSGLVAAYSFNEGTGTTVGDASGNSNIGTISGATWSTQGHAGNALSFDGTNDLVSIADAASLDVTRLTLMAWVRPTTLSGWRTAILKERGSDGLAYALYAHDNAPRPSAYVNTGGPDREVQGTAGLPLNTWSHLSMTYDGTTMRLYVNGVQVATRAVTGNILTSTQELRIGGNLMWGEYFAGLIDDVRVYNRALSAAEITADMNAPVQ
jgi:chitinase